MLRVGKGLKVHPVPRRPWAGTFLGKTGIIPFFSDFIFLPIFDSSSLRNILGEGMNTNYFIKAWNDLGGKRPQNPVPPHPRAGTFPTIPDFSKPCPTLGNSRGSIPKTHFLLLPAHELHLPVGVFELQGRVLLTDLLIPGGKEIFQGLGHGFPSHKQGLALPVLQEEADGINGHLGEVQLAFVFVAVPERGKR